MRCWRLTWKSIDFETCEPYVDHQTQRAGRQILHRETRTEDSDEFLPLSALCLKALRMHRAQQLGDRPAVERDGRYRLTRLLYLVAVRTTREAPGISPGGLPPAVHSAGFEPATF